MARHWARDRINRVHWAKTPGGRWHDLWGDNLSAVGSAFGVYVIALALPGERDRLSVYMGEGNIRQRLQSHRRKPKFKQFRRVGKLVFTWTEVDTKRAAQGIETHLHVERTPCLCAACCIGDIPVNIPRYLKAWIWAVLIRYIKKKRLKYGSGLAATVSPAQTCPCKVNNPEVRRTIGRGKASSLCRLRHRPPVRS